MVRAATSLPVPDSPSSSTVESCAATWRISVVTLRMARELPLSMRDGRGSGAVPVLREGDAGVPVNEPARTSAATILLDTCPCVLPWPLLVHGAAVYLDLSAAVMLLERMPAIL